MSSGIGNPCKNMKHFESDCYLSILYKSFFMRVENNFNLNTDTNKSTVTKYLILNFSLRFQNVYKKFSAHISCLTQKKYPATRIKVF